VSYRAVGADAPVVVETDTMVLARVDANTGSLVQWTKDEDRRRKIAIGVAIAGAFFAAVRLGFIVLPHFRKKRQLGEL